MVTPMSNNGCISMLPGATDHVQSNQLATDCELSDPEMVQHYLTHLNIRDKDDNEILNV